MVRAIRMSPHRDRCGLWMRRPSTSYRGGCPRPCSISRKTLKAAFHTLVWKYLLCRFSMPIADQEVFDYAERPSMTSRMVAESHVNRQRFENISPSRRYNALIASGSGRCYVVNRTRRHGFCAFEKPGMKGTRKRVCPAQRQTIRYWGVYRNAHRYWNSPK
jgi:hypothetical protein